MAALDLEHFLPYRLSVLSNRVSQAIARTYEQRFGLSVTEWRVIAIIGRYPGLSATEVAQRSAMDKVAISRAVRRLLDQGRIEREHNDADRRARHLHLSTVGREIHDEIVPAALAFERRIKAALSEEENRMLERLIGKIGGVV
ncbi:MAG TPA: MarR family transcriptional regulator [Wenzhouxiangellaceae bacterium]|nr:MarR family transcriptional regulator [Wenzhouxiangellaceae bacterium]